jgi:hypothetical protein
MGSTKIKFYIVRIDGYEWPCLLVASFARGVPDGARFAPPISTTTSLTHDNHWETG